MKDLKSTIAKWSESNSPFAVATVIRTWGSSPRPVGSTMIVDADGNMAGSVSGGCVEGAVVKEAMRVIESGEGKRLAYGVTDDDAWAVGLSCGGKIQVYVRRFPGFDDRTEINDSADALMERFATNTSCAYVTALQDGRTTHTLVESDGKHIGGSLPDAVTSEALRALNERRHTVVEDNGVAYFVQSYPHRSQMLVIGAAHVTTHLVELAKLYDFETVVIDPRGAFASRTMFSSAPDSIIEAYPSEVLNDYALDQASYAVILSHDPKIDDDALRILLKTDIAYIGALGSKKTHARRTARLAEAGFSAQDLERIHAPIGANINARTPKEISLSIMAEIISVKNAYV